MNCGEACGKDNPYAEGPVTELICPMRPGGTVITARALDVAELPPGAVLLDIGCGAGATVELVLEMGYNCWGIDLSEPFLEKAAGRGLTARVQRGDAKALPFPDASFDGVLLECSLTVMGDKDVVLAEAARVLKKKGRLMLSDLFAPAKYAGALGVLDADGFARTQSGFACLLDEDYTEELRSFYSQMIFEMGGARQVRQALLGSGEEPRGFRELQYRLLVMEKV